jgi:hypothetical protein
MQPPFGDADSKLRSPARRHPLSSAYKLQYLSIFAASASAGVHHHRSVSCRGGRFKGVDKFFARMSSDVQGISLNIHQTHNTTDRHLYCKYQTCVVSHSKMAVRLAFTAPTTLEAPGICSIAGRPAKLDASLVQVEHLTESTISAPAIPTQSPRRVQISATWFILR